MPNGKEIVSPRHVRKGTPHALVDFWEWSRGRGFSSAQNLHSAVNGLSAFETNQLKLGDRSLNPVASLTKQIGDSSMAQRVISEGYLPVVNRLDPSVKIEYVRGLAHAFYLRAGTDPIQQDEAKKMIAWLEDHEDLSLSDLRATEIAPLWDFRYLSSAPLIGQLHVLKVHLVTLLHETDSIDEAMSIQVIRSLGTNLIANGDPQREQKVIQHFLSAFATMHNDHGMWEVCVFRFHLRKKSTKTVTQALVDTHADIIAGKPTQILMRNVMYQGQAYEEGADNRDHVATGVWWCQIQAVNHGFGVDLLRGLQSFLKAPPGAIIPDTFDWWSISTQFLATGAIVTLLGNGISGYVDPETAAANFLHKYGWLDDFDMSSFEVCCLNIRDSLL